MPRLITPFLFLLFSLFPTLPCFSQKKTTPAVDSALIFRAYHCTDSLTNHSSPDYDTLPDNIQYYDPAAEHFKACASQGNIGKAVNNLVPSFNYPSGFSPGYTVYDPYRYNPDKIPYYHNYFPFTDLHYVMGGKKEQILEFTHSQAIGKHFTANGQVRIINSPGSYTRQKSDISNLAFSLQYQGNHKRYQSSLAFCQNILKMQENGGITKDSIFEFNTEPDRRVIPVHLQNAQNRIRESSAVLWQEYKWISDSALLKHPILKYFPGYITHSARYTENSIIYEDLLPFGSFYPFPPKDSSSTQSELLIKQLRNKLLLHNVDSAILFYAFGLGHEYITILNKDLQGKYSQFLASLDLKLKLPLGFTYNMHGNQVNGGYNGGDNSLEMSFSNTFSQAKKPKTRLTVWTRSSRVTPSWTQQHYHSNLFSWDNSFYPVKIYSNGIDFQFSRLVAGYQYHQLKSYIYYAPLTALPEQITETQKITQAYLQFRIKVWKIVLENRIDYQKVKSDYIRLPEYISRHSVFLDLNLIHGALILQPGVDFYWQSSCYADAYMPATSTFFLQNSTKINDQFYADVFITMKVSRARFFLKYQHFNSRMGAYDYYLIPHYPQQDAAIRFGVSWLLRDLPDKEKKFEVTVKK